MALPGIPGSPPVGGPPGGSPPGETPAAPSAPRPAAGGAGGNPASGAQQLLSEQGKKADELQASELANVEDGTKRMLDNTTTSAGEASANARGTTGGDAGNRVT